MIKHLKLTLFAGAILIAGIGVLYDHSGSPRMVTPHYALAPDATFVALDGSTQTLADLRGKPVIVHFWATWCAPCITEFPALVTFAANRDIQLIAVSSDKSIEDVNRFLSRQSDTVKSALRKPNITMAFDADRSITRDTFHITMYPESILVDSQGRMVRRIAGAYDWMKEGGNAVRPLLPFSTQK